MENKKSKYPTKLLETTSTRVESEGYRVFKAVCHSQNLRPQDILNDFMRNYSKNYAQKAAEMLIESATKS